MTPKPKPWLGFQFTNTEFTALSTADFEVLRKADAIIQQTKKDRAVKQLAANQ